MDKTEFHRQLVAFFLLINEKIFKQIATVHKGRLTSSQFIAVATVADSGRMTMTALADRLGISRQQATKTISQLVESGYMRRIPSQKDRRIIQIDLTEQAHGYMEAFTADCIRLLGTQFARLDEKEHEELGEAIAAFNRILPHI